MRVGGTNMKSVSTRARQPKMAVHVLRKFWVKETDVAHEREKKKPVDA